MKPEWARWKVKHLAGWIAALAVAFATIGVGGTVVCATLCLPIAIAPRGRRVAAILDWVAVWYPLFLVISVYVTWLAAWIALGHPPRASIDDPEAIRAIAFPYALTCWLLICSPLVLFVAIGLTIGRIVMRIEERGGFVFSALLSGIVLISWAVGYGLLHWDPIGVLWWFGD